MNTKRRQTLVGTGMILFSLVGLWSALSHYLPQPDTALVLQFNPPPGREWFLEQMPRYAARPGLTALHVIPAALFMLLAPFQLSQRIRNHHPQWHRVAGRALVAVSLFIGLSGIVIGIVMPFGGDFERMISVIIGILFLAALGLGVLRARQGRFIDHRRWMARMLAIGFVPVTMRGLMISGVMLLDLQAPAIFGPTMFMGLVINLVIVELRLRRNQTARRPVGVAPTTPMSAT